MRGQDKSSRRRSGGLLIHGCRVLIKVVRLELGHLIIVVGCSASEVGGAVTSSGTNDL